MPRVHPPTMLSDDLLAHVFESLSFRSLLSTGAVCRQWLRAVGLCNAWQSVEKQRLRQHAAYLRGVFLRVELELSMRTGGEVTPPITVVFDQMPMWEFLAGIHDGKVWGRDDVRRDWDFARPEGLPPPRLGAQGYVVRLKSAALWQRRRRYTFCSAEDECQPAFLAFSVFQLPSGASVSDAKCTTTPDTDGYVHYDNLLDKNLSYESVGDALLYKLDSDCHYSAEDIEDMENDFEAYHGSPPDFTWHTPWIECGLHYDLEDDKFGLHFGMGSYDHNFGVENESDYVCAVMTLLGHAPSLTTLVPYARRRQAAALRAWLQPSG